MRLVVDIACGLGEPASPDDVLGTMDESVGRGVLALALVLASQVAVAQKAAKPRVVLLDFEGDRRDAVRNAGGERAQEERSRSSSSRSSSTRAPPARRD